MTELLEIKSEIKAEDFADMSGATRTHDQPHAATTITTTTATSTTPHVLPPHSEAAAHCNWVGQSKQLHNIFN